MNTGLCGASSCFNKPQAGMVLLICLIFLTALTLLGLSASADTILQKKLTANLQETERARQSALATLSWVENWLLGLDGTAPESCTEPCDGLHIYTPGDLPPHPEFEDLAWWLAQGKEAGLDPMNGDRIEIIAPGSSDTPAWVIEAIHSIPPADDGTADLQVWYRILARGTGRSSAAVSVVESTVVRSWPPSDDVVSNGTCPGSGPTAKCGRVSWRELR